MENNKKQVIKLNEATLHKIIAEATLQVLNEMAQDEGFGANLVQGAKSFFGKGDFGKGKNDRTGGDLNLRARWNAARTNYQAKGKYDKMDALINQLSELLDAKAINPNTTVAQLVGGKYNNGRYGTMTAMRDNAAAQGSKAQNKIYAANEE